MTTCKECFQCICENLEWNPSEQAKEALVVLRQFKGVFEEADAMIEDAVLQEICRNLAEIHFGRILPLDTKPIETIRVEYFSRTGRDLPEFFCHMAYVNTLKKDAEELLKTAAEKKLHGLKKCAEVIDAEKIGQNLIERFREQCGEMQKKKQTCSSAEKSCSGCQNCTCGKGGV